MRGQARPRPATCLVMPAGGGYSVCWRAADSQEFKRIVRRFHAAFPLSAWQPDERAWFVPEEEATELRAWIDRLFGDEVEWITTDGEPAGHTQRQQPSRPSSYDAARMEAHRLLYLLPGAPDHVVVAAFRALALRTHPDMGGDDQTMIALTAARDLLLKKPP